MTLSQRETVILRGFSKGGWGMGVGVGMQNITSLSLQPPASPFYDWIDRKICERGWRE
jgi:hypothetical protein